MGCVIIVALGQKVSRATSLLDGLIVLMPKRSPNAGSYPTVGERTGEI